MSETVLRSLFFHAARLCALEATIRSSRMHCAQAHASDSLDPIDIVRLADALVEKCVRTGDMAALHESKALFHSAAALSAKERGMDILNGLGHALRLRCEHYSEWSDLDEAIHLHRTALAVDPDDIGSRMLLARALLMRYTHTPSDEDASEVMDLLGKRLPDSISPAQLSTVKSLLAEAIQKRLSSRGLGPEERHEWDQALLLARQGVEECVSQDPLSIVQPLTVLGTVLRYRVERFARTEEIAEATAVLRKAVAIAQRAHPPACARARIEQSQVLWNRFVTSKSDPSLLVEAEQLALQALDSYPERHYAHDLAFGALEDARTTRLDDVGGKRHEYEELIDIMRCRLAQLASDHPKCTNRAYDLAGKLLLYYHDSDELRHLDEAMSIYSEVVKSVPKKAHIWPFAAVNLAHTLLLRQQKASSLDGVDRAIFFIVATIPLVPDGHYMVSWSTHLLGVAWRLRYRQTYNEDDLDTALLMATQAYATTSPAWRIETCDGLANCLKERFRLRHDHADLDRAIILRQEMLDDGGIRLDHPSRSEFSRNLAEDLLTRLPLSGDETDFSSSMDAFADAVATWGGYGGARQCLKFAVQWISAAERTGDGVMVLLAYVKALGLLPRLANLGLDLQTRLTALTQGAGLACDAALHALAQKAPTTAVELLEQGRGVFWQQSLQLRSSLPGAPTALLERYKRLCHLLEMDNAGPGADYLKQTSTERSKLVDEFDDLVTALREVPELTGFLRPRTFDALRHAAADGPVALLLANNKACETILFTQSDPQPRRLVLAKLTLQDVRRVASAITAENTFAREAAGAADKAGDARLKIKIGRQDKADGFDDILSFLWTAVVHPVIQALGLKTNGPRTRIFWIPTGLLTFLPFHAAGIYTGSDQICASNYVVSSYVPTINALLQAQRAARRPQENFGSEVLLVAEPSAHGAVPLPHTLEEVVHIQQVVPDKHLLPVITHPSVDAVMGQIVDCSILHLACHGQADRKDPLRSGFLLGADKLNVRALMRLNLSKARFAFLSACQSALGDEIQPDESVHLASAMLFVGFPSVVGTMWSMNDADGPAVAREVYSQMFAEGKADYSVVPYALDAVVQNLRSDGAPQSRWATYIHLGA